jgi:hypothetical protein
VKEVSFGYRGVWGAMQSLTRGFRWMAKNKMSIVTTSVLVVSGGYIIYNYLNDTRKLLLEKQEQEEEKKNFFDKILESNKEALMSLESLISEFEATLPLPSKEELGRNTKADKETKIKFWKNLSILSKTQYSPSLLH